MGGVVCGVCVIGPLCLVSAARLRTVLQETRRRIEGHWARRFGMPVPGLAPVMVGSTGRHLDNALVLLLGDHAYVDAPPAHLDALAAAVGGLPPAALLDPGVWTPRASGPVLGPADHFWADHSTPLAPDAEPLDAAGRDALARDVSEHDWREAGFDRQVQASFGIMADGEVVAASVVTPLWGWPLDVGILVRPDARGRGHGRRVAEAALGAAVGLSGFACYRVDRSNAASRAIAQRLGLVPYGANLSVTLPIS